MYQGWLDATFSCPILIPIPIRYCRFPSLKQLSYWLAKPSKNTILKLLNKYSTFFFSPISDPVILTSIGPIPLLNIGLTHP